MAFVNISKVTLDSPEDVKQAIGDVMLVCASIVHDEIIDKKYNEALRSLEMLKCSIGQLEYVLSKNNKEENT